MGGREIRKKYLLNQQLRDKILWFLRNKTHKPILFYHLEYKYGDGKQYINSIIFSTIQTWRIAKVSLLLFLYFIYFNLLFK